MTRILAAMALLAAAYPAAAQTRIWVDPAEFHDPSKTVDTEVTFTVRASGLPEYLPDIGPNGLAFGLTWNPAILEFKSFKPGSFHTDARDALDLWGDAPGAFTLSTARINGLPGDATVAEITFKVTGLGYTWLRIGEYMPGQAAAYCDLAFVEHPFDDIADGLFSNAELPPEIAPKGGAAGDGGSGTGKNGFSCSAGTGSSSAAIAVVALLVIALTALLARRIPE